MNTFSNGNVTIVQTKEQFVIIEGERISNPFPFDRETIRLLLEVVQTDETVSEIATRWEAENKAKLTKHEDQ